MSGRASTLSVNCLTSPGFLAWRSSSSMPLPRCGGVDFRLLILRRVFFCLANSVLSSGRGHVRGRDFDTWYHFIRVPYKRFLTRSVARSAEQRRLRLPPEGRDSAGLFDAVLSFRIFRGAVMAYDIEVAISDRSLYISNDGVYDVPVESSPIRVDLCVDGGLAGLSVSDVSLSDYVTQEQLSSSLSAVSPVIFPVSLVRWVGNGQASRVLTLPFVPAFWLCFPEWSPSGFFDAVGNYRIFNGTYLSYGQAAFLGNVVTLTPGSGGNDLNRKGCVVHSLLFRSFEYLS